jgi:uroporphyrinogen-III decarboxylase
MNPTPKQRMEKAMNLEKPDRVPVMCQMSIGHMVLQTGFFPIELWCSAQVFSEALLQLRKAYNFDGILISLHGHSPDWEKNIKRIDKTENELIVYWRNGDKTEFPKDDLPRHYPRNTATTRSLAELDPSMIGDEIEYIPVSQGLDFAINSEHKFDIFQIIHEKAGSEFSIHGEVTSPFDYFLNLLGFKQALMHLLQDPSKCKKILQRFAEGVKRLALEMADQKIDAIKISSPYAGQGFISPEFYREFVLPFESQIARAVRDQNIHVYTHTCGSIGDRLEMMAESGISGLECLDPPPLGNVELAEAKKRVGHEVFIKGNMDPVNTLLYGNKEAVRDDAEYRLRMGKPDGGYILSTACSIAPHTKKENVEILVEVAEEKGYY